MIKNIEPSATKKCKSILPNPGLEYRIVFKKNAIDTIQRAKGWRTLAEMARNIGITRSYLSMLKSTRVQVTATIISRIAVAMGNVNDNWWIYYDIIPYGVLDYNHPVWNQEKYMGRVPYERYSPSCESRSLDYSAEKIDYRKN